MSISLSKTQVRGLSQPADAEEFYDFFLHDFKKKYGTVTPHYQEYRRSYLAKAH